MKITYDPEVDVLRILFADTDIEKSDEEAEGVILDYDSIGQIYPSSVTLGRRKDTLSLQLMHKRTNKGIHLTDELFKAKL